MRVLFVTRDDQPQVFGGDTVMVRGIRKFLQLSGVSVSLATAANLPTKRTTDVVHLTFLHLHESVKRTVHWADDSGIPIVISPLFEDPLILWFEWAIRRPGMWRGMRQLLGWNVTRNLYTAWQRRRITRGKEWREQRDMLSKMHIVPNSRYELDHLKQWFQLPDVTATVIPLGVDPEIYAQDPHDRSIVGLGELTGYILEVGRIETRKNQLGLLQALRHSSLPIVLLGSTHSSEYEASYLNACQELARARGNVYFIERVPEEDMVSLYSRAAVHVLPSWSERPGLVSLEAAACSCKVICSEPGPIYEYLGSDAWYCMPQNSRNIASAIKRAMNSPTPERLRCRVLTQFTWENTARQLLRLYEGLVS